MKDFSAKTADVKTANMERVGAYLLVLTLGLPIYLIGLLIGFGIAMLSKKKDAA